MMGEHKRMAVHIWRNDLLAFLYILVFGNLWNGEGFKN